MPEHLGVECCWRQIRTGASLLSSRSYYGLKEIQEIRGQILQEREQFLNNCFSSEFSLKDEPLDETVRSFFCLPCDWNEFLLFCSPQSDSDQSTWLRSGGKKQCLVISLSFKARNQDDHSWKCFLKFSKTCASPFVLWPSWARVHGWPIVIVMPSETDGKGNMKYNTKARVESIFFEEASFDLCDGGGQTFL